MSATPDVPVPEPAPTPPWTRRRGVTTFLRWAIAIAVVLALLDTGQRAAVEFRERTAAITLRSDWLAGAAGLYLVGWLLQSGPWMASLPAFGGGRSGFRTLAAYLRSEERRVGKEGWFRSAQDP